MHILAMYRPKISDTYEHSVIATRQKNSDLLEHSLIHQIKNF